MNRARPHLCALVLLLFGVAVGAPGCDLGPDVCGLWNNNPNACPAGAQTQTCPVLMNVTGRVTVWECNLPPHYCNEAPGQNEGPLAGCGCVICQTSEQAALEDAQQILAMQSVSVDPSGPPLQCRGPVATLNQAYDTGPLFTVGECTRATQATCRPCDDGQGGTLQSVGQYCNTGAGMAPVPGGYQCCAGLTCSSTDSESGTCQGTLQPCPQAQPNWKGLDTGTLRTICTNNNVNGAASQTGITLNRTCGVAFELWVLTQMGQANPRWTKPIPSSARQQANLSNGGLPASVIPEYVGPLSQWWTMPAGATDFSLSTFFEVKAVNGTLTPSSNYSQILGLLDVAHVSPAGMSAPMVPSPALVFTTTSNTILSPAVGTKATGWNVGIWQQIVQYDANGGTNPNLRITVPPMPLNPAPYSTPVKLRNGFDPWPHSPLTSPTAPLSSVEVDGDPDPDSATLVP